MAFWICYCMQDRLECCFFSGKGININIINTCDCSQKLYKQCDTFGQVDMCLVEWKPHDTYSNSYNILGGMFLICRWRPAPSKGKKYKSATCHDWQHMPLPLHLRHHTPSYVTSLKVYRVHFKSLHVLTVYLYNLRTGPADSAHLLCLLF